ADIIAVRKWRRGVCCLDMLLEPREFLLKFVEHDGCFPLFELFVAVATMVFGSYRIMRSCPLSYFFIPHVSEYGHAFSPLVVVALDIHGYHVSGGPIAFLVVDVTPYTSFIFEMVEVVVEVRYPPGFQYDV